MNDIATSLTSAAISIVSIGIGYGLHEHHTRRDHYRAQVYDLRLALTDLLETIREGKQRGQFAQRTTAISVRAATLELDMAGTVGPFVKAANEAFGQGGTGLQTFMKEQYFLFDGQLDKLYWKPPGRIRLRRMHRTNQQTDPGPR